MGRVCAAIGVFDGVHLGHQLVIRQTVADARQYGGVSMAVTFDRHPNEVVAPERAPEMIYTLEQRLEALSGLGLGAVWVIPFDREFSLKSGEVFIREFVAAAGPVSSLCVGSRFTFGNRRSGNVELLARLGGELGFTVHGLGEIALEGAIIRSTRVREAIRSGALDEASQMLGRAYAFEGRVVTGDGLGRRLGFPTANLDMEGRVVPANGVYVVRVMVGGDGWVGRGAMNIGVRPTLGHPEPRRCVEVHLLDFDGDLVGAWVRVEPLVRLRGEQRFPDFEALKGQLARDVEAASSLP